MSRKTKKREPHLSLDEVIAEKFCEIMRSGFSLRECTVKYANGKVERAEKIYIDWKGKIRIEHKTKPGFYCFSRYNPEDMLGKSPKFKILETEESYILT